MDKLVIEKPVNNTRSTTQRGTYIVKRATFEGDEQWKLSMGHTISVKMKDKEWLKEFRKREHPVLPGDSLDAQIKITFEIDDYDIPIEDTTSYEVEKVFNVIKPEKYVQTTL